MRRTTIVDTVIFRGTGLHTGEPGEVRLHPDSRGIRFRAGNVEWMAEPSAIRDTRRCTVTGYDDATLATVEHLLSALFGCGITDVLIEADGPEVPALDGSASEFVKAIQCVGVSVVGEVSSYTLRKPVSVVQGDKYVAAFPGGSLLSGFIHFNHSLIGTQAETLDLSAIDYATEIAPARTFGFDFEVEQLRAAGLAMGAKLDNALLISDSGYSSPLRVPNEPLRHKMLDFLGDLMMAGAPLHGVSFVAVKPGHSLNAQLAARLAEQVAKEDLE